MISIRFRVTLYVRGPVITQSTSAGGIGVDAPVARVRYGPFRGAPYFPLTLVQGNLRDAWSELGGVAKDFCNLPDTWFGPEPPAAGGADRGLEPSRKRLMFSDFILKESGAATGGMIYRIRIDGDRGVADDGALQVIECPVPPGAVVEFVGECHTLVEDLTQAQSLQKSIDQGFRWIAAMGAEKSVGFGQPVAVRVELLPTAETVAVSVGDRPPHYLALRLRPLAPFCIAKRRQAHNVFESETTISGAVLKGCLATMLNQRMSRADSAKIDGKVGGAPFGHLCRHFERIRLLQATPTPLEAATRPACTPLSFVRVGGTLLDVALLPSPGIFEFKETPDAAPAWLAPRFQVDWKGSEYEDPRIDAQVGMQAKLERELRVRTAIDASTRRARAGQIFAQELIIPDGHHWLGAIDLSEVPKEDLAVTAEQLLNLCAAVRKRECWVGELEMMGKTKVSAVMELQAVDKFMPLAGGSADPIQDDTWIVVLNTPMLLVTSEQARGGLAGAYAAAWNELSGQTLKLVRYFATQSLAGGIVAQRLMAGRPYNPFLLTDAGSTFVLQMNHGKSVNEARSVVEDWMVRGVPIPDPAIRAYRRDSGRTQLDYLDTPFLNENGFGEVSVNMPCHVGLRADAAVHKCVFFPDIGGVKR